MKLEELNVMNHREVEWHDVRIKTNSRPQIDGSCEVIVSCKSDADRCEFLKGLKSLLEKHTVEGFELTKRIGSTVKDL